MTIGAHFRVVLDATVHGHSVILAGNGRVYFPRDLHDALPDDMQGRPYTCNTPREFEALCRQFEALT